jgi:two-component system sensor histidine kinase/response regulator
MLTTISSKGRDKSVMKKQILIVEDENDCAELLSYHLQKDDYQTEIARNGKEAIEAVRRQTPDAVLLDVMMPELNGWEVCRILRESATGKFLPIIMLSALSDEEARIKGLNLGADDYLPKPYSMKELLLKIRKHIDQQQTIKQLEAREQEQNTTLRTMVHELKNSLNVIGGFSSIALRKDDSNKYLRSINTAAFHAERLLDNAPRLSRLETREETLPVKPADIRPLISVASDVIQDAVKTKVAHQQINAAMLISEIAETTRILIKNKPISVEVTAPAMDVMISTDNVRLRQILINLVSNATKFTEEGKISITLSVIGSWMEIAVSDTGIGIREEDLHKLFIAYGRIGDAKTKKHEGTGLGLTISRDLADLLGGSISVASIYGKGTTFIVSLPMQSMERLGGLYNVE